MKKLHIIIITLGVLLAAGFNNRSAEKVAPAGVQKYFIYMAYPSDNPIDLGNPDNYELTANDGTEVPICSGVAHRCAVLAEDDGTGRPNFGRTYTIMTRS
jgi:hypothetical protein